MNVLCLYPGIVKEKNDNAFMLIKLRDNGVFPLVIASKSLGLKGKGQLSSFEEMDGVHIYRFHRNLWSTFLFPFKHLKKILQISEQFHPDLIFCSQELNMRLAILLQKHLDLPIVLLSEDAGRISSGEAYQGIKVNLLFRFLGVPTGRAFWPWLCENADALITCHPRDSSFLQRLSQHSKPVSFLPWPTHIPSNFKLPIEKKHFRGVYVGSLYPFKNTQEFEWTLPRLLSETPTKEFIVVGPGPHAKIIKRLQESTGGLVKYVPEMSRLEALRLIASSYYAYTPVAVGGWGFIGDCWSVGTPVVMTHNDNYVSNGVNALVAEEDASLFKQINRLYSEEKLYNELQQKGKKESELRRTEFVSENLSKIFKKVVRKE